MRNFWAKQIFFCLLAVQVTRAINQQSFGSIAGKWKIKYGIQEDMPKLSMRSNVVVHLPVKIYDIERNVVERNHVYFEFATTNPKIATVEKRLNLSEINDTTWHGVVTVEGHHFGYTQLVATLNDPQTNTREISDEVLDVQVLRDQRLDIKILTYSAAAIMLLMFVNLGTVLDLERVRLILILPVGPVLGFFCRYFVMPGVALGLGALLFQSDTNLQLALLFTAVAPSGGIANICNVFLKGNINLSLACTALNSVMALAMLPIWVYLMGPVLYRDTNFNLPFLDLAVGCVGVVLALVLGVSLRTFVPKTTRVIFRYLKPISVFLSLSLVAVTVGINAFAFTEVTAMIFLASLFLPVLGYVITFTLAKLLRRTVTDAMTIAIETSILNMSLPIVLLEYTVEQPIGDMLVVVPILSAVMSICLATIYYAVRRVFGWNVKLDLEAFDEEKILFE